MSDVKILKLMSSEEIVATIITSDECTMTIDDAVTLAYQPISEGKMSVGFAPFMPQAEGQIVLDRAAVAAVAVPKDALLQEYNRVHSRLRPDRVTP